MKKEELEKKRAAQKQRRDTTCRHFTGCQNGTCEAGVNYRDLVGGEDFGWMARTPCIPDSPLNKEPMAKCDFYQVLTPEEIAARDAETEAHTKAMIAALQAIRKDGKDRGEVPCPKCGTGSIAYTKAKYNGHIWGRCSTEGCLTWMM